MKKLALLSLIALLTTSCTDRLPEWLGGRRPIEERPAALPAASAAPASHTSPGEPDPRLEFKLPDGREASYEYAEAARLRKRGQLMAATFLLMGKALGESGSREELQLLLEICRAREDGECEATIEFRQAGLPAPASWTPAMWLEQAKQRTQQVRALLLTRLERGEDLEKYELLALQRTCQALRDEVCLQAVQISQATQAAREQRGQEEAASAAEVP